MIVVFVLSFDFGFLVASCGVGGFRGRGGLFNGRL